MLIKVLICDDDMYELKELQKKIIKIGAKLNVIVETFLYTNGREVVELVCNRKEKFDIIFLDIVMTGISGIEVAKRIRESALNPIIFFVSSYEKYVFDAMECQPLRYIRKKKIEKELFPAIKAALDNIYSEKMDLIILKTREGDIKIHKRDIMYIETEDRKKVLHIRDGTECYTSISIKNLTNVLGNKEFIQVHSGCIVNLTYISIISNEMITLDNGENLIISRRKVKEVRNAYLNFFKDII